jgi:hypothetical protein
MHVKLTVRCAAVPAEKSPNGTCVFDADCVTSSTSDHICSSTVKRKICRCANGLDSCEDLPTCMAPPTAPVQEVLSPCNTCKRCIGWVRDWQAGAGVSGTNDSLTLATRFMAQCTSNFTSNDVAKCRGIAGSVAFSFNGNLAKRAGALCARLGDCTGDAATSKCNVTDTAGLDLCTANGDAESDGLTLPTAGKGAAYNAHMSAAC